MRYMLEITKNCMVLQLNANNSSIVGRKPMKLYIVVKLKLWRRQMNDIFVNIQGATGVYHIGWKSEILV